MNLMKLSEYEEIKGGVSGKDEAFEKGQIVAFAYMADCMGCSLVFNGMEELVKKIESGRKRKGKSFDEWKADNSHEIEDLADYFMRHDTEAYFVHVKYLEAYEKIESLCKIAFDRK